MFALLGPNGAGKSTTVKILTTLSRPDSGTVGVGGFDVLREPVQVRRIIGCVAQKSTTDLEATGSESLTLQGQLYGLRGTPLETGLGFDGALRAGGRGEPAVADVFGRHAAETGRGDGAH